MPSFSVNTVPDLSSSQAFGAVLSTDAGPEISSPADSAVEPDLPIFSPDLMRDPKLLAAWLGERKADIAQTVAALQALLEAHPNARTRFEPVLKKWQALQERAQQLP